MKFRYARHCQDILKMKDFYAGILGMDLLGGFQSHAGYDGIFLGKEGCDWEIEFTQSPDQAVHHPDEDDLLVFYIDNKEEWDALQADLTEAGIELLEAKNPYWNKGAMYFLDPEGFGIVLFPKFK